MSKEKITRICLWSGPRNISTALMYSFAQRTDTQVFDEPLYAFYLSNTDAIRYHPGARDTIKSMEPDGPKVVANMMNATDEPVLFFKNMAHHLLDLNRDFMRDAVNIILTRDPAQAIVSFSKVIESPTMRDLGYNVQLQLAKDLHKMGATFMVVDSARILENPEQALRSICELAGIPFDKKMLTWPAGARPEDGTWAEYWYENVHRSTGFAKHKRKQTAVPEHLTTLLNNCQSVYQKLTQLNWLG